MTRFLVLRFSSIGDIVLTTPVVRCLHQQYPEAEIHYLTKPAFKAILEPNPYIHQVHVLDTPLLQKIRELKQLGFDYVIDLHNNLRTRIIKAALDVPSFSFDKLNTEKAQLVNWGINTLPAVHIVDRYLDTLSAFGIINDGLGLDYFFPDNMELPNIQQPYIAIAIGAQHATKRLPTDMLIELCKQLDGKVLLLGGKEDAETGNNITAEAGNHVQNLCGQLSLAQSAYVVSKARKVIAHDTGLMHIAAACKVPVVSIWGNTVPAFGMTAYYGNLAVNQQPFEVNGLSCRPCSKIGHKQCPQKHFDCMRKQPISLIAQAANS